MRRKYIHTLVAIVVLGGLWGSFALYDRRKAHQPSSSTTATKPQEKILGVDSGHIQSFTIQPRDGKSFTCRREGSAWVIAEPAKLAADQSSVSGFLSSLADAAMDDVVDPHPGNLKDFGLDPPAETVKVISDSKPQQFTLLLGDETPTSGGLYAQVAGNPRVFTLATYLKSSLEKSEFDLRDKRAVTLNVDQVRRIDVDSKGKRWTLEKNPEGVWDLVLPPPVRADHFATDGLISQLRGLSLQSILAEDKKSPAKYGLNTPTLTVKLTSPAGSQTLTLGKKDGDRYDAMNSALSQIFTLDSGFLTQFQKDPADLRDKDLFSFSTFDAKHLEVETPAGHWVFDQQKDKWKETSPKQKELTADKIDGLLADIHGLRADSFPKEQSLASFGLTKPQYRFQVRFGDKNQTEVVEVSKVGDHVYARRTTDSFASELSKSALDSIDKQLGQL
jgi:hypothetical protein